MADPISTETDSWVVVADQAKAVFYKCFSAGPLLCEEEALECPEGRAKRSALTSDREGRSFDSVGGGRHTLGHEVDPHAGIAQDFSRTVAARIKTLQQQGSMVPYTLCAAPKFLGELRKAIDSSGCEQPVRTFDKDWTHHDTAGIQRLLERASA